MERGEHRGAVRVEAAALRDGDKVDGLGASGFTKPGRERRGGFRESEQSAVDENEAAGGCRGDRHHGGAVFVGLPQGLGEGLRRGGLGRTHVKAIVVGVELGGGFFGEDGRDLRFRGQGAFSWPTHGGSSVGDDPDDAVVQEHGMGAVDGGAGARLGVMECLEDRGVPEGPGCGVLEGLCRGRERVHVHRKSGVLLRLAKRCVKVPGPLWGPQNRNGGSISFGTGGMPG